MILTLNFRQYLRRNVLILISRVNATVLYGLIPFRDEMKALQKRNPERDGIALIIYIDFIFNSVFDYTGNIRRFRLLRMNVAYPF